MSSDSESPSESSSSASFPADQFHPDELDSELEETEKRSGIADSRELDEVVVSKRSSNSVTENPPSMPMNRQSGPRISLHWESLVEVLLSDELLELSLEVSESESPHLKSKSMPNGCRGRGLSRRARRAARRHSRARRWRLLLLRMNDFKSFFARSPRRVAAGMTRSGQPQVIGMKSVYFNK
jgi:hypothetical protein